MRSGYAQLPLHNGKAPHWLFSRMKRLSREIMIHLVTEYGPEDVLQRFSDPFWFQALGCVLGFDWHSSGVTTTTCGAVKEGISGLEHDLGLFVAGGKGARSRRTPMEITEFCDQLSIEPDNFVQASKLSAKVDNSAVQDGYQLYHHNFFFTAKGEWCVVQQGLNESNHTARRYHWLGTKVDSFVNEPHSAICCDTRNRTLNLVAEESHTSRDAIAELARQPDRDTLRLLERLPDLVLPERHPVTMADINPRYMKKILLKTYEQAPKDFANLLGIEGVGAKTLRALALVAEVIYGKPASMRDPARFSFAHGGKDGTPYPVDRSVYEQTIDVLHQALQRPDISATDRVAALKRLASFAGPVR
jgi:hypothetical protein